MISVEQESSDGPHFHFTFCPPSGKTNFDSREVQDYFFKWGMQDHIKLHRFSYDHHLEPYHTERFLLDFFNDPEVNGRMKVLGTKDRWASLGKVTRVDVEETGHSVTSLSFFERILNDRTITRPTGEIIKILDTYHESFLIPDALRLCLLDQTSPTYDLFPPSDRSEFIFHLFKALCLGGALCQYEDEITPYLDVTKKLYKDLISVVKDSGTGQLRVASRVWKVSNLESSVSPLFPLEHVQNFCYVSVDPVKRIVNVLYHASDSYY
ncbi:hypothetical protein DFS34DRAFT_627130 [Phlyctochytrium arcticum]|nr:hypothetical protein DFS34DRAFT_640704 [Phlyctochytrium arcticum]KAI9095229.1 hypothetical protein DFS34DRAFT_627130 [Phlyctochytrium arcticum]